jgi:hypothetical protein
MAQLNRSAKYTFPVLSIATLAGCQNRAALHLRIAGY